MCDVITLVASEEQNQSGKQPFRAAFAAVIDTSQTIKGHVRHILIIQHIRMSTCTHSSLFTLENNI